MDTPPLPSRSQNAAHLALPGLGDVPLHGELVAGAERRRLDQARYERELVPLDVELTEDGDLGSNWAIQKD